MSKPQRTTTRKTPRRKREYRQDARAQQTEANGLVIVDATVALIRSVRRLSEIGLEDIARKSGLTVRTVLRRYGSRDGVFEAAFARLREEIIKNRPPTPAGDQEAGLVSLLNQYEHTGDLNIRALEEEDQLPLLHKLLEGARAEHRQWLEHVFGPHIPDVDPAARERTITALYAATDVYLWKLLRRDLRLDISQTADTFRLLVGGVMKEGK